MFLVLRDGLGTYLIEFILALFRVVNHRFIAVVP